MRLKFFSKANLHNKAVNGILGEDFDEVGNVWNSDIIRGTVKRSDLFGSWKHGLPLTDFDFKGI